MKQIALVSAIIPAFNEEKTIAHVAHVLLRHPLIGEVIVVDDGSTDKTVETLQALPVRVVQLGHNSGKATAMNVGVATARYAYIFFCDADVLGLNEETVTRLITPVLSGRYAMYVGIRERKILWLNKILHITPILGGERVLSKDLWYMVPTGYKKNFQIEIALNYFSKQTPARMGFERMPGVTQIIKEKKYGFLKGFPRRIAMMWDVLWVGIKIYGFEAMRPHRPVPRTMMRGAG